MYILITGGAGYIGSHMSLMLREAGHEVLILDSLEYSHHDAAMDAPLAVGEIGDSALLDQLLASRRFDAVMHFASYIQVGESVAKPASYYRNNVAHTLTLLDAMVRHKVPAMVFSSSAAVYGDPHSTPIDEHHPCPPINPYGRSKLIVEEALADLRRAHGLGITALRYFNAAGADPKARLGERHAPETHLIPLALRAALGSGPPLTLFGENYDTPDGTCFRDYIHVQDLCTAHLLVLNALRDGDGSGIFNLGNGQGFSVRQVIQPVERVTGKRVPVKTGARRPGAAGRGRQPDSPPAWLEAGISGSRGHRASRVCLGAG